VSSSGSKKEIASDGVSPEQAVERLEDAVNAALEQVGRLEDEVARMRAEGQALEGLLKGVTSGKEGPREMIEKLQILEEENRDLRSRLEEGRAGVERILARVKFLEEKP
jgi:predicted RNase H-like nuclease (RuvC/YqgF family)